MLEGAAEAVVFEVAFGAERAEVLQAQVAAVAVEVGAAEEDDGAEVGGDDAVVDSAVLAPGVGAYETDIAGEPAPAEGGVDGGIEAAPRRVPSYEFRVTS